MKTIVNIILAILFFASCNKETQNTTSTPANPVLTYSQKRNILTTGYWYLTHINNIPFTQECSKDDKTFFNIDGTIIYDQGTILCNPFYNKLEGTFVLDSAKTAYIARVINIPAQGATPPEILIDTLDVIKFDSTILELQFRNQQKTLSTYEKRY